MEVKSPPVKAGWVEKRSNYLKQWRRRWLVLTSDSLSSYKSERLGEKSTERIQLAAILDVAQDSEVGKENAFRIELKKKRFFIATAEPDLMTEWVQAIKFANSRLKQGNVDSLSAYYDKKSSQEANLKADFSLMKTLLSEREAQLQTELETAHQAQFRKAEEAIAYVQEVHNAIDSVYKIFSDIYQNPDIPSQMKILQLREIASSAPNLGPFDAISESTVHSYANEQLVALLLRQSVKVSLENQNEASIRRTDITRALKWRYNGERFDALSFSVSKDTSLTAVGLCSPHKPNAETKVRMMRILMGDNTQAAPLYMHDTTTVLSFSPDDSVQKVPLGSTVLLKADTVYTLQTQMEGASSYKCVDCMKTVKGRGDVIWTFSNTTFLQTEQSNRTDVVCGPIADFYYLIQ